MGSSVGEKRREGRAIREQTTRVNYVVLDKILTQTCPQRLKTTTEFA